MNTWVGNQVGLKFGKIDIECTIESKRCGDRANDLSDQSIQVGVRWSFNVQIAAADVVDGLWSNERRTSTVMKVKNDEPLSTMKAQSECSSVVCVVRIELYGSTTAVEICGAG